MMTSLWKWKLDVTSLTAVTAIILNPVISDHSSRLICNCPAVNTTFGITYIHCLVVPAQKKEHIKIELLSKNNFNDLFWYMNIFLSLLQYEFYTFIMARRSWSSELQHLLNKTSATLKKSIIFLVYDKTDFPHYREVGRRRVLRNYLVLPTILSLLVPQHQI